MSLAWPPHVGHGVMGPGMANAWASLLQRLALSLLTPEVPAMREAWIRSLGWEDPLEEVMATHSSVLA